MMCLLIIVLNNGIYVTGDTGGVWRILRVGQNPLLAWVRKVCDPPCMSERLPNNFSLDDAASDWSFGIGD